MANAKQTKSGAQVAATNASETNILVNLSFFHFATEEASKWSELDAIATRAILFWAKFLDMRMGTVSDGPKLTNDEAARDRLKKIVRALSWVESRHGTGSGNHPDVDPMQCGNPNDTWWQEVSENLPPPQPGHQLEYDRFIGGPNVENYWANELPNKVITNGIGFPNDAKLSRLDDDNEGHRDRNFNQEMGFF